MGIIEDSRRNSSKILKDFLKTFRILEEIRENFTGPSKNLGLTSQKTMTLASPKTQTSAESQKLAEDVRNIQLILAKLF